MERLCALAAHVASPVAGGKAAYVDDRSRESNDRAKRYTAGAVLSDQEAHEQLHGEDHLDVHKSPISVSLLRAPLCHDVVQEVCGVQLLHVLQEGKSKFFRVAPVLQREVRHAVPRNPRAVVSAPQGCLVRSAPPAGLDLPRAPCSRSLEIQGLPAREVRHRRASLFAARRHTHVERARTCQVARL